MGSQHGWPAGRFCLGESSRSTAIYIHISIEAVNGYASKSVHLHDPQTLYRHWKDEKWSPFAVDLSADVAQWAEMAGEDRSLILWALSSLMVAEERITTQFSGLVGAYERRGS